jgi:plastocyanin
VTADDGSFESPIMAPGEEFKRTFDGPGPVKYFCNLHGAAGGQKMGGTVNVK